MAPQKKRKPEGEVYPIFAKKPKAGVEGSSNDASNSQDSELDVGEKLSALREILDFSGVDTEEEISRRFERISTTLLHEFRLVVRRENATDVEFEILEAEFYLQIGGCHEDPFTHGSEEQRVSGRWYVHSSGKGALKRASFCNNAETLLHLGIFTEPPGFLKTHTEV